VKQDAKARLANQTYDTHDNFSANLFLQEACMYKNVENQTKLEFSHPYL